MTVTLSSRGQLVIPAAIRKRHRLTAHTKFEVFDTGRTITLVPLPKGDPFLASRGILKGFSTEEFLRMRRAERRREERELKRFLRQSSSSTPRR